MLIGRRTLPLCAHSELSLVANHKGESNVPVLSHIIVTGESTALRFSEEVWQ